jgi:hypothetical protein
MLDLTDLQKIGLGLVGFGSLFLTIGIFLFLDRVLLALGNILFLTGLCLLIGVGRTLNFFWQPHNPQKMKGTFAFFGGIIIVLVVGWPLIGMLVEFYGFFVLFSGFLPVIISFIRRIPIVGSLLNLPLISTLAQKYEAHPMV